MIKITLDDVLKLKDVKVYNKENFFDVFNVLIHISNGRISSREFKNKSPMYMDASGEFDLNTFNEIFHDTKLPSILITKKDYHIIKDLDTTIIVVPDVDLAYGELAKIWRTKLHTKIISITGSNGKTSVKEMSYCLMKQKYEVIKSIKNSNNNMGVPFNLFHVKEHHQFSILEHGTIILEKYNILPTW